LSETNTAEDVRNALMNPPRQVRRALIKSFGCQMNVYDSQRMADLVALEGYAEAGDVAEADLIVLNTCHIREKASEKIFSELGKLRELKEERRISGRRTMLVVAGCVAQAEGGEILRRQPAVDVVVGPQSYHRLPELLREAEVRSGVIAADFPVEDKFSRLPASPPAAVARRGVCAFVTVQEGCDKFCSFCVVPYTRGAESSRPVGEVVAEVAHLARAGVREPGRNARVLTELSEPALDWTALARGMGVPGVRAETAGALSDALGRAFSQRGPCLIEAVL